MKTGLRLAGWIFITWLFIQLAYQSGYKKTTDEDYIIPDPPKQPMTDSTKDWSPYIHKRDTTKYKGKWVDTN